MELFSLFHSIWTVLLVIIFIGIVIWAWSGKRKGAFERAARAPLEDDEAGAERSAGGR